MAESADMPLEELIARAIYEADPGYGSDEVGWAQLKPENFGREMCMEAARAVLSAIEGSGRRIVPVEPTPEQVDVGEGHGTTETIYIAMVAAAPKV